MGIIKKINSEQKKQDGFILLDALFAIIIVTIGFVGFYGAIFIGAININKQNERVAKHIIERNEFETSTFEFGQVER